MSRRQGYIIIALLAVIAVALAVLVGFLIGSRGADGPDSLGSAAATPDRRADHVAALEAAGLDVVEAPPVPEAPETWGDYKLDASWDGQVRVFEDGDVVPVRGESGEVFPASQNGCGLEVYLVTFRSVGEGIRVEARLVNAVGASVDSAVLQEGWMLGTNCVTPSFAFHESDLGGGIGEVAYTVHRYRQSSVAESSRGTSTTSPTAAPVPAPEPVPQVPAQPTFVECVPGLASLGIYSDGSTRRDTRCPEPDVLEAERVCGGMYGWREVSRERYVELCGQEPPTGG
ncbi:MAG: hypothetical protein GX610_02105 [Rhodococcus sp.]|nr:hypothetical protein [Rhodococcus sp. (in: high G+C Gram-positive bacteria)]